jgi:hypothetical protein
MAVLLARYLLVGTLLTPSPPSHSDTVRTPRPRRDAKVWVNPRSRIYHCPGSKWFGVGRQGHYSTESTARRLGYRPAFHRACGT